MNPKEKLIVVVSNDEEFQRVVALRLRDEQFQKHTIQTFTTDGAFAQPKEFKPVAVLVDLDHAQEHSESVLLIVQKLATRFSESRIVCISASLDVQLVLKLIRVGANDFLKFPFDNDEIKFLLAQVADEKPLAKRSREHRGQMITIFSPKGGAGVTLLACNLAVQLSRRQTDRVSVCDPFLQCGDVATYLNLSPKYTIRDLVDQRGEMDWSLIEGVMLRHESTGIRLLSAPRPDQTPLSVDSLGALASIYTYLKQENEFVLIDGGHQLDSPAFQTTLEQSDHVILLGGLDVPSLKGLVYSYDQLIRCKVVPDKIKVVINRYNAKAQLNANEFERKTKHLIACYLPNNYPLCIEAVNTGRVLRELRSRDPLVKQIDELASLFRSPRERLKNEPPISLTDRENDSSSTVQRIIKCLF